jgi:uncharacterized protein
MPDTKHGELVAWLSTPAAYRHAPARVDKIETHISVVFLAGEEVYKLKKPVRFDFLDFTTIAARERACRDELRLNRRLAPDIYLDVLPVTRAANGELQLGGIGPPVDWLVHMRKLPTHLTLEALQRRGELTPAKIDTLAELLVRFYRSRPPLEMTPDEYRRRTESHVRGNRAELLAASHHLPRAVVQRVHAFQLQLLALQPDIFDARVRAGRIVDGHGDLRPEHIVLSDPPAIFDCIEFNAEFRQLDAADELAFLAAECDLLGAEWVGLRLLERYREQMADDVPAVLWSFYRAYRACVRAKVAALRADQQERAQREAATTEALAHLRLADGYAAAWQRPLVLVTGGLSGTGKSTLAAALAAALGAEWLRTDVVRRELVGGGGAGASDYSDQGRQRVYNELFGQAAKLLALRVSVILDGTFSRADNLRAASGIAAAAGAEFLAIECICRPETARQRIVRRMAASSDPSEAGLEVFGSQRQAWRAWPADTHQCPINTELPMAQQEAQVLAALATALAPT